MYKNILAELASVFLLMACLVNQFNLCWSFYSCRVSRNPGGSTRRLQPICTKDWRTWASSFLSLIGWERQDINITAWFVIHVTRSESQISVITLVCDARSLQDLRLPSVTTIAIPNGYDWREMLAYIMKHHQMEMTGGLGPSVGMVGCCS